MSGYDDLTHHPGWKVYHWNTVIHYEEIKPFRKH